MTMDSPLIILQISDLHILAEKGKTMEGVETEQSFIQLLKHIQTVFNKIDLLLVTGDLAQDPCQSSYQRILQALKHYKTRTICLPGNHDDFSLMQQILADKQVNCDKLIQFKYWQIISLNSKKTGSAGGYLKASELGFLTETLDKHPELNTLIAVHHHPIPTDSLWMDTMTIENSHELFSAIKAYPKVKAISCGHIHQEMKSIKDNKLILGTPSTCFQFKPFSIDYAVDENKPGYRVLSLYPNGRLESKVYRSPYLSSL